MLRFLKVLEIPDFETNENYLKEKISEEVVKRISKNKISSVLVRSELTPEDEKTMLSWGITGVYPSPNGLYVNPEELKDRDLFAQKYVQLYGGSPEDILFMVRQRDLRYVPIYQKLSLVASDEVQQYVEDEKKALAQGIISKEESIGGFFILTPRSQRIYPERTIGAQVMGFIDNEGKGHYGLEGYYDDVLR